MDVGSRRQYELACRDLLVRTLDEYPSNHDSLGDRGFVYIETRLVGTYPDTRLIVVLDNVRTGDREAHGYALWGDRFRDVDGSPGDPQWVVDLTLTLLQEPSRPDDPDLGEIEIIPFEPD